MSYAGVGFTLTEFENLTFRRRHTYLERLKQQKEAEKRQLNKK